MSKRCTKYTVQVNIAGLQFFFKILPGQQGIEQGAAMFRKYGFKIGLGFGFIFMIMLVLALLTDSSLGRVHEAQARLQKLHQISEQINNIKYNMAMESSSMRARLLYRDGQYVFQYRYCQQQRDRALNSLLDLSLDPADRKLLLDLKKIFTQYDEILVGEIEPLAAGGQYEKAAEAARNKSAPLANSSYDLLSQLDAKYAAAFNDSVSSTVSLSEQVRAKTNILGAVAVLIGLIIAFLLTGRVTAPVSKLLQAARAVAGGDLGVQAEIRGRDEIAQLGEAFDKMVGSLRQQRDELQAQNEEIRAQQEELSTTLDQVNYERAKLAALNDFDRALNQSIHLTELCQNMMNSVMRQISADACAVAVIDQDYGSLKNVAAAGINGFFDETGGDDGLAGLAGRCIKEKESLTLSYPETLLAGQVRLGASCRTAHEAYIPIIFRGNALGVVVAARLGDSPFRREEADLLGELMRQGGIALNNAMQHAQVEMMYEKVLEQAAVVEELNAQLETEKLNLKQAEETIRAVIESLREAVAMVDLNDRVVGVNRRWTELLGADEEELHDQDLEKFYEKMSFSIINFEQVRSDLEEIIKDQYSVGETEAVQENRVLKIWTGPVLDSEKKVLGRLYVFRDVTKEAEVDRMKSEFVSTVSHELRTPLSSILGFAELLLMKKHGEEASKKYISTIHKEARRLTSLVNDFLDLQRMESGRQEYHLEKVGALELIKEVTESFNTGGHRHRITIKAPEDLAVLADRERIGQVILNLLSNAVKYSPQADEVIIGLDREGDWARFYVEDKGLGIPQEVQEKLFNKFYRVDNSDRREIGGTGLGLAICKEIVTAHGGEIGVHSDHGRGSTFFFTVRLASPKGQVPEKMTADGGTPVDMVVRENGGEAGPAALPAGKEAPRVLVVEDDQSLSGLFRERLSNAGYRVEVKVSGEEALVAARATVPEAIVLDILLAGEVSGWDVLRQLKDEPGTAHIPILVTSCLSEKEKGLALGAEEYLIKPFSMQKLVDTIDKLVYTRDAKGAMMATRSDESARAWILEQFQKRGLPVLDVKEDREITFIIVGIKEESNKGQV